MGQEALAAIEKTARRQNALILFRGRIRRVAAAVGAGHLGTPRPDARAAAPLSPGSGCRSPACWRTNPMAVTPTSSSNCVLAPTTMKR